jgi:hypothetical protein
MANFVTHRVRASGPEKDIQTLINTCFSAYRKDNGSLGKNLDFDKIIPSPEIVKQTSSGSTSNFGAHLLGVLSGECAYDEKCDQKIGRQAGEDVTETIKRFFKENPEFEQAGRFQVQCLNETGFIDWYTWNIHHWGTKWNAFDGEVFYLITHDGHSIMEFTFDTAWSVPEPIWNKLPGLFPDVVFKTIFFEESWSFAGEGSFNETGEPGGLVYHQPNHKEKKWRDFYKLVYSNPNPEFDYDEP